MSGHPGSSTFILNVIMPAQLKIPGSTPVNKHTYSLIAFDQRVTFWFQRGWPLPCACAYVALYTRRLMITIMHAHTNDATNANAQVSGRPYVLKHINYSQIEGNRTL